MTSREIPMWTFRINAQAIPVHRLLIFLIAIYIFTSVLCAQESTDSTRQDNTNALRVFIDCSYCDLDYIRQEITFVNYVRDRNEAQVHALITTQQTGSGGTEYTITFIGQHEYIGINDTLSFTSKNSETDDIIRKDEVKTLKLGLVRYVAKTPLGKQISISYESTAKKTEIRDPWDYWIFSLSSNGYFNGQQRTNYLSVYGNVSANRTTTDLKVSLSTYFDYSENNFQFDDTTEYKSVSRGKGFSSSVVFSLTDHWSAGGLCDISSSTYSNRDLTLNPGVAIEYNIFPYSESTRRQLRIAYALYYNYYKYIDETIYDKSSETLAKEDVSATLDVKEPWGSSSITLEGSHFFYDLNKYRLQLYGNMSIRLIEGLSLRLSGNISKLHDQISLPKGGATTEEVLLQRRELETNYNYYASVGISYSFGSIYNNIVNARFGNY
jgi:hypothetical protein